MTDPVSEETFVAWKEGVVNDFAEVYNLSEYPLRLLSLAIDVARGMGFSIGMQTAIELNEQNKGKTNE